MKIASPRENLRRLADGEASRRKSPAILIRHFSGRIKCPLTKTKEKSRHSAKIFSVIDGWRGQPKEIPGHSNPSFFRQN